MRTDIDIRPLDPDDPTDDLREMLARASQADGGPDVAPSHDTLAAIARAEGSGVYVAEYSMTVIGCVVVQMPVPRPAKGEPPAWFKRPGVAVFSQLAVEPEIRGTGVGESLIAHAEHEAARLGAEELACAVPARANRLRTTLAERGYRPVDHAKRGDSSFVIVSKTIDANAAAA